MPRSEITHEYKERDLHNDAIIILISSFSSSLTYILIDKMVSHWKHPWIFVILSLGFIAIFFLVMTLLRLKKTSWSRAKRPKHGEKNCLCVRKNHRAAHVDKEKILAGSRA